MKNLKKLAISLLLLVLVLFLAGACQRLGSLKTSTPPASSGAALDLSRALYQKGSSLGTFAARGSINLTQGRTIRYFKFEFLAKRPSNFILTVLDPMGRPALKIISNRDLVSFLDYRAAVKTVGSSSSLKLEGVLAFDFTPSDFISFMSNSLIPNPEAASVNDAAEPRLLTLLSVQPQWAEVNFLVRLEPGADGARIKGYQFKSEDRDKNGLEINYDRFLPLKREDGANVLQDFPHNLTIKSSDGANSLVVRYDEARLGLTLGDEFFLAPTPAGFKEERI
ncbi:MAG: DUF4292 domain-containing protein [Deltaproteobacteria bacterium]|jgi:outer membrane lipoprotein-sorting protein|nr:DUF4292 domain-containing protein [Deltaproteobacteria bacterium]